MIIIAQIVGTTLTNIKVSEQTFATQTGATDVYFGTFEFDGNDWQLGGVVVDIADYGITFDGTPVLNDAISVAYNPETLYVFEAGDGINQAKINYNFAQVQQQANTNESNINNIASTALLKDGSNLTQTIVNEFQQETPNILSTSGTISLSDNTVNFLTLTGNGTIALPTITSDQYSHTISLIVAGSSYTLDITTATGGKHLYNNLAVDTTETYNVLFVYNKIDDSWYYSITQ